MTVAFVSISHALRNLSVQAYQLRGELLNLHFEVFAFANQAIELRRPAVAPFFRYLNSWFTSSTVA